MSPRSLRWLVKKYADSPPRSDIVDARDITYDDVSSIFFASFTRANDDYHASEMASLAAPTTPA